MSEQSPRPTPEQLARYADGFNQSASMRAFGVKIHFPSGDKVVAVIDPIQPAQRGGLGMEAVNGGVLAAMFDLVIGCTPALIDPRRRTATVHLSMSFERPLLGDVLRAEGWIDSAGTSTIFSSGRILDGTGKVCARCQGIVKLSKLSWKSGESPAIN